MGFLGLIGLLTDGEQLERLLSLSPEEMLLRWVNYHLQNAGTNTISNFSEDIKVHFRIHRHTYTYNYTNTMCNNDFNPFLHCTATGLASLLLSVGPDCSTWREWLQNEGQNWHERPQRESVCLYNNFINVTGWLFKGFFEWLILAGLYDERNVRNVFHVYVKERNLEHRAELMLRQAARLDCRQFVSPQDVTSGNSKLNLAFVANLFNMHPSLQRAQINGLDGAHFEGETHIQHSVTLHWMWILMWKSRKMMWTHNGSQPSKKPKR